MTPGELAGKRPAQTVTARPAPLPAQRGTGGRWVPAFVFLFLPILFLAMAGLGYATAR